METHFLTRRNFLKSAAASGIALTLTSSPLPPTNVVYSDEEEDSQIPVREGLEILNQPEVLRHVVVGKGSLWVAGRLLSSFRRNFSFGNLPVSLQAKYHYAGAEYKSLPAARGLWESVPAPVRAAGPEALWKFHQGKDWSHIVPRSVGGPATADNGVWWSSIKNRRLGPNAMSAADLADARAVLRSEAIRSTIKLTLNGMVKGAIIGVIAGALLASLEYGLEYAEGEIGWKEMILKIARTSVLAGLGGLVVTGLIVGISLLFPFMIPIFAPLLFAAQVVSLLFLGRHLKMFERGWWDVLESSGKLADFTDILRNAYDVMQKAFDELRSEGAGIVIEWLETLAERVGVDAVWEWIASRTQFAMEQAGELAVSLADWDNLLELDAGAIGEAVARVVATEFEEALSTTEGLLESISDYRKSSHRKDPLWALAV